jgi:hypothetical protein
MSKKKPTVRYRVHHAKNENGDDSQCFETTVRELAVTRFRQLNENRVILDATLQAQSKSGWYPPQPINREMWLA